MPKGNEGETFLSRKDVHSKKSGSNVLEMQRIERRKGERGEEGERQKEEKGRRERKRKKTSKSKVKVTGREEEKAKEEIKRQNKEKTNAAHEWTDSHDGGGLVAWQEKRDKRTIRKRHECRCAIDHQPQMTLTLDRESLGSSKVSLFLLRAFMCSRHKLKYRGFLIESFSTKELSTSCKVITYIHRKTSYSINLGQ